MTTSTGPVPATPGVERLDAGTATLARDLPDAPDGTLFALGERGGVRVAPGGRVPVLFGRNEPEVHVGVGVDDPGVSRVHGMLSCDGHDWTLRNTGSTPIRFPGSRLLRPGHEEPIAAAYTPLFVRTDPGREHLLEVRVARRVATTPSPSGEGAVRPRGPWALEPEERLVLVALGEHYLRHDAHPRPVRWSNVLPVLTECDPGAGWTDGGAEEVVAGVRRRLADAGVDGLTTGPTGESDERDHNLLVELLVSTSLVPPDLRLLHR